MDKKMKNNLFLVAVDYIFTEKIVGNQKELAEKIGISDSALSRIKNGTKTVSDETIRKMNEAFGGIFNLSYFRGQSNDLLLNIKPEHQEENKSATVLPSALDMSFIFERIESANNKTIEVMEAQIARLEDSIKTKDKLIQVLEARIKDLELCNGKDKDTYPYPMSNFASDTTNNNDEI